MHKNPESELNVHADDAVDDFSNEEPVSVFVTPLSERLISWLESVDK